MDEHLKLEFNEWAKAGRCEGMEKAHRPVGEQAISQMKLPINGRVLDVGCGSGWASRVIAEQVSMGQVTGIDISDEMVTVAAASSRAFTNIEFKVASAESLPFRDNEFTHAFSMESIYYYSNMLAAFREIHRVLNNGGLFVTVIDLYLENTPSHQWIYELKVPVHLFGVPDYRQMLESSGYVNVRDERLYDLSPVPADYTSSSFSSREDYLRYKANGSLMLSAEVRK
jgi:ubiquinone/menaquinone biosynthesis C-methylase UbiE